jgi:prophage regulatory protein
MSAARFEATAGPALVPLPVVMQITGYGRSMVYEAMAEQLLPRPVKLGRASRWPEHEVLAVHAAIVRGDDEGARRALVRQLRAQRGAHSLHLVRG